MIYKFKALKIDGRVMDGNKHLFWNFALVIIPPCHITDMLCILSLYSLIRLLSFF